MEKKETEHIKLEQAILAAIILEKEAFFNSVDFLRTEYFQFDAHKKIYISIKELAIEGVPLDTITVANQLKEKGLLDEVGGGAYLAQITNQTTAPENVEAYSNILASAYARRSLEMISKKLGLDTKNLSLSIEEILEKHEEKIYDLRFEENSSRAESLGKILPELIKKEEEVLSKDEELCITSTFSSVDSIISGFFPGEVTIIAGRPGMGKTAFMLDVARNLAYLGHGVVFFSLEMPINQVLIRLTSPLTGIPVEKLRRLKDRTLEETKKVFAARGELAEKKIYISDSTKQTLLKIKADCRRLKMQAGLKIAFIDYLQIFPVTKKTASRTREQEIAAISSGLKRIAIDLDIHIIAGCQLNRAVETRGGERRPHLSDLRESGAIEQDADTVAFIYRPEYYGIKVDRNGNSTEGMGEIIIAKNRYGKTGSAKLIWNSHLTSFTNY